MATLFERKAPWIMKLLMKDFHISKSKAAAILGNIGHECNGFKDFQELKPLVPGSRGGYGWAMWTGSRRRQFEAYCERNRLSAKGDKANYGFLYVELTGSEKAAMTKLMRAPESDLMAQVVAFESFERAHPDYKHYPSRKVWAERALAAYNAAAGDIQLPSWADNTTPVPEPAPAPVPAPTKPVQKELDPEPTAWYWSIINFILSIFGRK